MAGFNSDVTIGDSTYHVQTQEIPGGVESLVYRGGQVVYAHRAAGDERETQQLHQDIVERLQQGSLELWVGEDEAIEVVSLSEEIEGTDQETAGPGGGLVARLAAFVRGQRAHKQRPASFRIDSASMRKAVAEGSGVVTAQLLHDNGAPVAGAEIEVECFRILGPSKMLMAGPTDDNGCASFACDIPSVRPGGLLLRSRWHGGEATARFLV